MSNENENVDMINHPPHYARFKFEPIDVLADWFPSNPLLWQVGKYIARAEHKGNVVEDLKKARFYLDREIERLEKKEVEEFIKPIQEAVEIGQTIAWKDNISGVHCIYCKQLIILGQLANKYWHSTAYIHRECWQQLLNEKEN